MVNRTIVISFGHRHAPPPPCDVYVDVRELDDRDYELWIREAKEIIKHIEPGNVVAVGCTDGDDRSVHIARLIQKYMDNVVVVDRDLGPDAHEEEEEKDATVVGKL